MPRAGPTALDKAAGLGADWGPRWQSMEERRFI